MLSGLSAFNSNIYFVFGSMWEQAPLNVLSRCMFGSAGGAEVHALPSHGHCKPRRATRHSDLPGAKSQLPHCSLPTYPWCSYTCTVSLFPFRSLSLFLSLPLPLPFPARHPHKPPPHPQFGKSVGFDPIDAVHQQLKIGKVCGRSRGQRSPAIHEKGVVSTGPSTMVLYYR